MANEKRLIDANAVKDNFCNACSTRKRYKWPIAECRESGPHNKCFKMRLIDEATNIDAVEVVHGRWHDVALRYTEVKEECSVCHGVVRVHGFRYCPNCGAKMDGDGNG